MTAEEISIASLNDVLEANRKAYQEARKRELIAKKASQKRLEEYKKESNN